VTSFPIACLSGNIFYQSRDFELVTLLWDLYLVENYYTVCMG
jgi:hypothetical protein